MKYIIAIIQPDHFIDVMDELQKEEIHQLTVTNVLGRGKQRGFSEVYRGHTEVGNLLKKIKLEIAVNDEFIKPTVEAISRVAKTGKIGDGKIFVLNLEECYRIRTGEQGNIAIG